jgi:hypothetical protein
LTHRESAGINHHHVVKQGASRGSRFFGGRCGFGFSIAAVFCGGFAIAICGGFFYRR